MTSGGETGNAPQWGPCSLFASWDQVSSCCGSVAPVEADVQQFLLEVATLVVWGLTKGQYVGQCTKTIYPCQPRCVRDTCCTCPTRARFDLGAVPVWWAEVLIDGESIPVFIEDYQYVVRNDGIAYWPTCLHDWSIRYTWGWPVPADISLATARLACEYAKQCQNMDCALSAKTTSITREGVSMVISDPYAMIQQGATGVAIVDSIIGNPMHQRSGGIVDLAAEVGHVVTWSPPVVPT